MTDQLARCEDCGLTYQLNEHGEPVTTRAYTCDDCGGYVDTDKSWWDNLTDDERDEVISLATGDPIGGVR